MVDSLLHEFAAEQATIAAQVGRQALDELLTAHRLWSDWLRRGRVRKFAFVAEKSSSSQDELQHHPSAGRAHLH